MSMLAASYMLTPDAATALGISLASISFRGGRSRIISLSRLSPPSARRKHQAIAEDVDSPLASVMLARLHKQELGGAQV
jgi:hypothetical protein